MSYVYPEDRNIWLYHEAEEPKIVKADEVEKYKLEGWAKTPAAFLKFEDVGIDREKIKAKNPEEKIKADQVLQAVETIKDQVNGAINLENMNKNELIEYAEKHFELKLSRQKNKKQMIDKIRGKLSGDS